jgi:hypothetical protein
LNASSAGQLSKAGTQLSCLQLNQYFVSSREPVRHRMTLLAAAVDPHLISALANSLFDIPHFAYSVQGAGPKSWESQYQYRLSPPLRKMASGADKIRPAL